MVIQLLPTSPENTLIPTHMNPKVRSSPVDTGESVEVSQMSLDMGRTQEFGSTEAMDSHSALGREVTLDLMTSAPT